MNDACNQIDQNDDLFACEIADEAIEQAVWDRCGTRLAFTAAFCSGLDTCPGFPVA
ncbi:MAG TPA: hypothetical protein VH206_00175 [Xanthobacteraceae bacterium]|jgi:hypothetical protein|nr:hypothetical protein [Xanthobacteraceae bacterium]